jgi:hypothetical protein
MASLGHDGAAVATHRRSYAKTGILAAGAVGVCGALALALGLSWRSIAAAGVAFDVAGGLALFALAIVIGYFALLLLGVAIVLHRDSREAAGLPYIARRPRESRRRRLGLRLRSSTQRLGLRPGEVIEILPLDEILATLDEKGAFEGLTFMPEMAALCGREATVFRRVDKLNDWVHGSGLRRVRNTVLLDGLRCDGTGHDGCEANCHLRWKEAWLKRQSKRARAQSADRRSTTTVVTLYQIAKRHVADGQSVYVCQATDMASGAAPLAWGDPRHYVRDLLTGNIRLQPFVTGVAVAIFNAFQTKRGGAGFPASKPVGGKTSPTESLGLRPGDLVRVKSKHQIELTLNDKNRNRGLRFDREMLRYCGGEYRVRAVLSRVMVEAAATLRDLTTPCIVLEDVTATGEYYGFNPENEHIFWREIWLERVEITGG